MNIKLAIQLYKNMGTRYVLYRVRNEIEKRTGKLKKRHPFTFSNTPYISLEQWKKTKNNFIIPAKEEITIPQIQNPKLKEQAERILKGEILFFNTQWKHLGLDYDWITNPDTNFKYDSSKHWSEISDYDPSAGDIKFVWEKSRFTYLLTLIRYDYHFNEDLSEFVFSEIESWIEQNAINKGPNWYCSQEISLRIFNWCFALYYYQNSRALTPERWRKISEVIYASVHHVYHHIDFSRIAVRNNHAITETLFLTLSNILFPYIPETLKWSTIGKQYLEQEVNYQIYNDGTFLQFSMNYHRVVIQLFSLAFSVYQNNGKSFGKSMYERAYKSLNFLYQCMQDENGWLPNYGSNDGALFFPLSSADYRDYRPQLNTLHYVLTGKDLFEGHSLQEDRFWTSNNTLNRFTPLKKQKGILSFPDGGYYLCRNQDYLTFIRCGSHRDRPFQADNLHMDLWYKSENLLRDSGSYKYNTTSEMVNYFMGTESHNTVMVDNKSQMLKGGRFIWYFWSQKLKADWTENPESYVFEGEVSVYRYLNKKAKHYRKVVIHKNNPSWEVTDKINHLEGYTKKQIWHVNNENISISSNAKPVSFPSYNSNYYGVYTKENSLYFEFDQEIKTNITHKV